MIKRRKRIFRLVNCVWSTHSPIKINNTPGTGPGTISKYYLAYTNLALLFFTKPEHSWFGAKTQRKKKGTNLDIKNVVGVVLTKNYPPTCAPVNNSNLKNKSKILDPHLAICKSTKSVESKQALLRSKQEHERLNLSGKSQW